MIVRPDPDLAIFSIAACTSTSDFGSRAEVASSKIKILGFLIKALAIAILYFWPPDMFMIPAVPTKVSRPDSYSYTKPAFAYCNAFKQSYSVASTFPYNKLSRIVPIIIIGS